MPEEQDVHADHDGHQRDDVEDDRCRSSHRFVLLGAPEWNKSGAGCAADTSPTYGEGNGQHIWPSPTPAILSTERNASRARSRARVAVGITCDANRPALGDWAPAGGRDAGSERADGRLMPGLEAGELAPIVAARLPR